MCENEKLVSEMRERSEEGQKSIRNLAWKVLVVLHDDKVAADLQAGQSIVFLFSNDLVEDPFEDDEQANDKDRDDLEEQSPLVLFQGFATILIGGR